MGQGGEVRRHEAGLGPPGTLPFNITCKDPSSWQCPLPCRQLAHCVRPRCLELISAFGAKRKRDRDCEKKGSAPDPAGADHALGPIAPCRRSIEQERWSFCPSW